MINIVVEHELDIELLETATVRPILVDGEIDSQALADYEDFIEDILAEFDYIGLEVIHEQGSNLSKTSRYYTLADAEQYKDDNMKYIIYLRVSDHIATLSPEQKKIIRQKRKDDSSRLRAKYKVRNIIVDNKTFETYDDALEYVIKKAAEYKQTLEI